MAGRRARAPRRAPDGPAERAGADAGRLAVSFNKRAALGPAARVRAGLSDPHARGRTVAVVEFAAGARVVYKPRSLRADAAFAGFLEWLSRAAPGLPPVRAVRTLDRGRYGWAEYVAPAPCADAGALVRYYERCGVLLAAAYVLRVGDLHSENVVAAGEHPLLVDLEAALTPVLRRPSTRRAADDTTVLDTSLLPAAYVDAAGRGFVDGGIGARRECLTTGAAAAADPGPAVARGFDRAYRALQRNRAALLARGGPLAPFAGARVRVVVRATTVYAALLRRLADPARANDPAARAAELDRLSLPFRGRPEWAHMLPAFAAEARALARGDVPRFELAAGGTALRADGRVVVPHYASASGLAAVRRRVRALGDADRCRQLQYIRLAFAADAHRTAYHPGASHVPAAPTPDQAADQADALAEARRLGALLVALAERSRDGRTARWQVRDDVAGAPTLRACDASLGHGQSGIGLLFAALHACEARTNSAPHVAMRQADAPNWAAWARHAFEPACAALVGGRRLGRLGAAGFASGAGGVAFALGRAAEWLDDAPLRARGEDAVRVAGAFAAADGLAVRDRDVFGGSAGAVMGLLACYEQTRNNGALALAANAGAWLAGSLTSTRATRVRRCRHAPGRETVPGFGLGAPGRASVLLRLAVCTGDVALARMASRALTEAASDVVGRLAGAADLEYRVGGWCRGDIGVGFALAAALVAAPRGDGAACWRDALGRVAEAAAGVRDGGSHALCCGVFARVDLLLDAAEVLGDAGLSVAARRLARAAVVRAARRLAYHPVPHAEPFAPALFSGLAGVAYTLLRVACPDVVPSVLRGAVRPGTLADQVR